MTSLMDELFEAYGGGSELLELDDICTDELLDEHDDDKQV